jgi:sterol 3beta-glucosyltransferase
VEEHSIEFYSLGGDPTQLMAFMVKNRGLLLSVESLRAGDIGKWRKDMAEIIDGC